MEEMAEPFKVGDALVKDVMRFFIGDHPELQFESGNSQGGNYPCVCGCHSGKFGNTAYAFKNNFVKSLDERRTKLIEGPAGRQKNAINPYGKLKVKELEKEIFARDLVKKVKGKWLKDELDDVLKMDLAGLCRIPAVCFLNPSLSLERINLKHYEISLIEP
ncbi:uncharacterized protein [Clytia hemisphaerica]